MSSGAVLWEVLRKSSSFKSITASADLLADDIDPEAFSDELPSVANGQSPSGSWDDNLTNLKHIYESLTTYLIERCKRKLPLSSGEPDLKAIAQSTSEKDVIQFLKLVLLAAVFGRFSMDYIQQLISFTEDAKTQFFLILKESEALEVEEAVLPSPLEPSADAGDDKTSPLSENGPGNKPGDDTRGR